MSRPASGRRPTGDAGTISIVLVLLTGALFSVAGLVWDGGRAITARQHAADLAEQAARAGANDLDLTAARTDGNAGIDAIDTSAAIRDACHYVQVASPGAGCVATATRVEVTVHVTTRTSTAVLGIVGINSLTSRGYATASPVRGVTTGEDQR